MSLFSGVGCVDKAAGDLGMELVATAEIEPFPCRVLDERLAGVPNLGDVTSIDPYEVARRHGRVDVISGGFPCQDLSVAGKRRGLAGDRSGLFWEFVRICRGIAPTWVVLENVPGLLSSNEGRDFALVIHALGELGYGLSWRVLNAQHFGVPQRRRRVFIVGYLGGPCPPEILFESEGVRRDLAPSTEAGEEAAQDSGDGAQEQSGCTCGSRDGLAAEVRGNCRCRGRSQPMVIKGAAVGRQPQHGPQRGEVLDDGTCYTLNTVERHVVGPPSVEATLGGGSGNRGWADDTDRMTFITCGNGIADSGTDTRGNGTSFASGARVRSGNVRDAECDKAATGTERAAANGRINLIPSVFGITDDETSEADLMPTLPTPSASGGGHPPAVAFAEVAGGLTTRYGKGVNTTADDGAVIPVAFNWQATGADWMNPHQGGTDALHAGQTPAVAIQDAREVNKGQNGVGVANPNDPMYTLDSRSAHAVAFAENQRAEVRISETHPQLTAGGGKPGQGYPAVIQGGAEQDQFVKGGGVSPTLAHSSNSHQGHHQPKYWEGMAVRRLTPTECARLTGMPDWWLDIEGASDSAKYRAWGNAIVYPVAKFILGRLKEVHEKGAT